MFLLLLGLSYFSGCSPYVTYILSWKRKFYKFPCWLFYFSTLVHHLQRRSCHDISFQWHYTFNFTFLCHIFVSSRRTFLFEPSCESMCIIYHTSSCCNIIKRCVCTFGSKYSAYFIACFSLRKISNLVPICTIVVALSLDLTYL